MPRAGFPVFFVDRSKSYSHRLAFCIAPTNPIIGGGIYNPGTASISQIGSAVPPPVVSSLIAYKNYWINGNAFTTSHATCFQYSSPPPVVTSDGTYTGDYSFLWLANPPSEAAYRREMIQGANAAGAPGNAIIMGNFSGATNSVTAGMMTMLDFNGSAIGGYGDAASVMDGAVHCFIGRRQAGIYTIYKDGINVTSAQSGASNAAISNSSSTLCLGGLNNSTEDHCANCTIGLAAGWNRALQDGEMRTLGTNPFDMFFTPDPLYVITSGAPVSVALAKIIIIKQAVNRAATF